MAGPRKDDDGGEEDMDSGIPVATWPEALPHPDQELIFTISCGNTHYYWAVHQGPAKSMEATLYWRTCALPEAERTGDPCKVLARYLPETVQELIYTNTKKPPKQSLAMQTFSAKRVPFFNVYIVSTNPHNESGLAFLFQALPCQLFSMDAKQFYSEEQGAYPGMGIDRLASAKGATEIYGAPCMIMDGGTALTYTRVDEKGNVAGGGICSGLALEIHSLYMNTGMLPKVNIRQELELLRSAVQQTVGDPFNKKGTPIPLFPLNTKQAILGTVMREKLAIMKSAIADFSSAYPDHKDKRTVCLAGGDGRVLEELLTSTSIFLESTEANGETAAVGTSLPENIDVQFHKYLIHTGIVKVISDQLKLANTAACATATAPADRTPLQKIRDHIIGQRVAREFANRPDADGDTIYRGTVVSIDTGDEDPAKKNFGDPTLTAGQPETKIDTDLYGVLFDDCDREDLNIKELWDALQLYSVKGEKWKNVTPEERKALTTKQEQAKSTAAILEEKSPDVKEYVSKADDRKRQKEMEKLSKKTSQVEKQAGQSKKRGLSAADAAAGSGKEKPEPAKKRQATSATKEPAPRGRPSTGKAKDKMDVDEDSEPEQKRGREREKDTPASSAGRGRRGDSAKPKEKEPEKSAVRGSSRGKKPGSSSAAAPASDALPHVDQPRSCVGVRVAKYFELDDGKALYFGKVTEYIPANKVAEGEDLWHVVYDDGDEEDYDKGQIQECLDLYQTVKKKDKKAKK